MSILRAVLVDFDGTLASTEEANLRAYSDALRESGVELNPETLRSRVQGRHWKEFLPRILTDARSEADPADVARRKREIYVERLDEIVMNRALLHLLSVLRPSLRIALVTSAARATVEALLRRHGVEDLFEIVISGDDVKAHKPDPEPYEIAARRLQVSPEECLIFEDSEIGIASAKAFGGHIIRISMETRAAFP
jgi:HAD superfamily hydrolase (TIGR01509 family)